MRCTKCGRSESVAKFHPPNAWREVPSWCCDCESARHKEDAAWLRAKATDIYGGCCVMCGETNGLEFDHVDLDGADHRRREQRLAMFRRIVACGRRLDDVRLRLLCRPHHIEMTRLQRLSRQLINS